MRSSVVSAVMPNYNDVAVLSWHRNDEVPSFGRIAAAVSIGGAVLTVAMAPQGTLLAISSLPNGLAFAVAAAVSIGVCLLVSPRGERAIALLAFSFVLTGWRYDTGYIVLEAPQVGAAICFIAWMGEMLKGRQHIRRFDRVGLFALLLVLAAWVSFFGAVDVPTWFKRAGKVTWLFGLYLFLVNSIDGSRRMMVFIRNGLVACAIGGLVLIGHTAAILYAEGTGDFFGPGGTFANTNEAATYLAIFVVLAAALYAFGQYGGVMDRRSLMFVGSIILGGVIATRSRTGLAATVLVPAFLFVRSKRVRRLVIVGAVLVMVTSNIAIVHVLEMRMLGTFGFSGDPDYEEFVQAGNEDRLYLLELSWSLVKARPVFGIGAGNYGFISSLDVELPPPPTRRNWAAFDYQEQSSHNGFMNWWVEAGTVGFVPFVTALLLAAGGAWRAWRNQMLPPFWRAVAAGVFGGIAVFVMTNLTGEFGVSEARLWMLLGFASIVVRHDRQIRRTQAASRAAIATPAARDARPHSPPRERSPQAPGGDADCNRRR